MADVLADSAFHRIVGQRISTLRKARKLTQAGLAELVQMDTRTIQRAESGDSALSIARMRRVAVALDVELAELFREMPAPAPRAGDDPLLPRLLRLWTELAPAQRELALGLLAALIQPAGASFAAAGSLAAEGPPPSSTGRRR